MQEVIDPNSGTGNSILSNSIFSNAGLGIQLGAEAGTGVTPNDGDNPATPQPEPDSDTVVNRLQNLPVTTSPTTTILDDATISGRLNSTPEKTFTIQFFSTPAGKAALFGPDEGVTFLGETRVTTNSNGNRSFSFMTARFAVSEGDFITATATRNSTGDTSEFSEAKRVEPPVNDQ